MLYSPDLLELTAWGQESCWAGWISLKPRSSFVWSRPSWPTEWRQPPESAARRDVKRYGWDGDDRQDKKCNVGNGRNKWLKLMRTVWRGRRRRKQKHAVLKSAWPPVDFYLNLKAIVLLHVELGHLQARFQVNFSIHVVFLCRETIRFVQPKPHLFTPTCYC